MITVIAGAGYTGSRVLTRLDPQTTISLGRSGPPANCRAAFRRLDLDQPGASIELPPEYAVLYTIPPAADADSDRRLARFLGLLDSTPGRFVYLSTSGVYGDRGGALVKEDEVATPSSARARSRFAAETQLNEWCSRSACKLVVLRVPGIYGPLRLGLERLAAGEPVLKEADAYPGNRIHVDDLVACCIAALCPEVPAGIYNVGDGDFRSATRFAGAVAAAAGLPPPSEISRADAALRFSERRLSFLDESRRLDVRKMRSVLKVNPRDPETGIADSLEQ